MLLAVPMQHLRAVAARAAAGRPAGLCAKGVETGTLRLPLEIVAAVHPGRPAAVLTGPNFAHEIAAGLPAAAVVAGRTPRCARAVVAALAHAAPSASTATTTRSARRSAAPRRTSIAIAAGAVMGAGLGENARAALITRGLAELSRLAVALGGRAETVMGCPAWAICC